MYEERFTGIAHAHSLCLCIKYYVNRHVDVGCLIHEDMAVSGTRLDHGYGGILNDIPDKSGTSARYQKIDILIELHHLPRNIP